jgi:hypothetical protein
VDNLVSSYIDNNLPIYMLYLPDMMLLRRSDVKQHLASPAMNVMVDAYLSVDDPHQALEESIQQMVKNQTAYAILSHRWLEKGELTFQDLSKLKSINADGFGQLIKSHSNELKVLRGTDIMDKAMVFSAEGNNKRDGEKVFEKMKEICEHMLDKDHHGGDRDFVKLVKFCEEAKRCGCNYAWLDTGCIDKQSSAELEESIRSMFSWYRNSKICIVHLSETSTPHNIRHDAWFTRGWTLQELLAPKAIKFFSKSWHALTANSNDKDPTLGIPLWKFISDATQIREDQLLNFEPGTRDVREKMVWVSKRQTTRIEDMAYCLIGIFDIPLSIAYGEGQKAFHRLQAEIVQRSHDRELFAWNGSSSSLNSMFAAGPQGFFPMESESLRTVGEDIAGSDPTYVLTNYGLRISLATYDVESVKQLGKQDGRWIRYELEVPDLKEAKVHVELGLPIGAEKLVIGILGNSASDKTLAILLSSPKFAPQPRQWKRMTTKETAVLARPRRWKVPEMIYIE